MEVIIINYKEIKLLILDCDGVLSDGKIYYNNSQIETKSFHAHDGFGIKLLSFAEIEVAIITGRKSNILSKRAEDLDITILYQGVKNKLKIALDIMNELELNWENVAYIGDDWNDYPVISKVAFSACPADAMPNFKKCVDFVATLKGGEGAVREVIEHILNKQERFNETIEDYFISIDND